VRAAHARLELLDHDPAGGAVAERVNDDGEVDAAARYVDVTQRRKT